MPDVRISDIIEQALALDSKFEVESVGVVSGQNNLQALIDLASTQIGGQVGDTFADIAARDLAAATLKDREFVEVTDASADPEVESGRAWFRFVTGTTFILLFSEESLRLNIAGDIQEQAFTYDSDLSGTPNVYAGTFDPPITSYKEGQMFLLATSARNTGPSTFEADGIGATQIQNQEQEPLSADDIRAGFTNLFVMNDVGDAQLINGPFWNRLFDIKIVELSAGVINLNINFLKQRLFNSEVTHSADFDIEKNSDDEAVLFSYTFEISAGLVIDFEAEDFFGDTQVGWNSGAKQLTLSNIGVYEITYRRRGSNYLLTLSDTYI